MDHLPLKANEALLEQRADQFFEDPEFKAFFMQYDVSYEAIKDGINLLIQYQQEKDACEQSLVHKEDLYRPVLGFENGHITLSYVPCDTLKNYQNQVALSNRIDATTMPKTLLNANLSDFRQDSEGRQSFYHKIMQTVHHLKLAEPTKGLYLHGAYMTGKTYALAAAANQFSKLGYQVTLMYYPDFAREIKSSIDQGTLELRISNLKKTDILMLDDLGGEGFSAWVRDEVLGPILQHRLLDQKLTYFTSNIPPKQLLSHFTGPTHENEKIKAFRIIERLQAMAEPIAF